MESKQDITINKQYNYNYSMEVLATRELRLRLIVYLIGAYKYN